MKFGIANGEVVPLSFVTVLRKAVKASSAWFDGEMDVGSDTSRYLVPLDMVAARVGATERNIGGMGCMAALVDEIQVGWWKLPPRPCCGPSSARCRHGRRFIRGTVSTRRCSHAAVTPPTLKMSSKKVVAALRPAVNGLGPRLLRVECPRNVHFLSRTLTTQASRPRKPARQPQGVQQSVRYASSEAPKEQLGKTGLYELHSKHGAKFVPFGGYSMPVQYSDLSIIDSHNWTREKASLFDVGHM